MPVNTGNVLICEYVDQTGGEQLPRLAAWGLLKSQAAARLRDETNRLQRWLVEKPLGCSSPPTSAVIPTTTFVVIFAHGSQRLTLTEDSECDGAAWASNGLFVAHATVNWLNELRDYATLQPTSP